jgi:hypothetical protein
MSACLHQSHLCLLSTLTPVHTLVRHVQSHHSPHWIPVQDAVRTCAAAQLHELFVITEPASRGPSLARPFMRLLADPSPLVLQNLLTHFEVIAPRLPRGTVQPRELVAAIVAADGRAGHAWRARAGIAAALPALADLLPPDVVGDALLGLGMRYLLTGVAAVKVNAAVGISAVFRSMSKERQRTEVRTRSCIPQQ